MNNNATESFENQVIRVLNEMVRTGEIMTKIVDGEIFYSKTLDGHSSATQDRKTTHSLAAKKAVNTRKMNMLKNTGKIALKPAVVDKAKKRADAANKAWVTRRAMAAKEQLPQAPFNNDAIKNMRKKLAATVRDYKKTSRTKPEVSCGQSCKPFKNALKRG